jgi:hypothetical protein
VIEQPADKICIQRRTSDTGDESNPRLAAKQALRPQAPSEFSVTLRFSTHWLLAAAISLKHIWQCLPGYCIVLQVGSRSQPWVTMAARSPLCGILSVNQPVMDLASLPGFRSLVSRVSIAHGTSTPSAILQLPRP